MAAARNDGRGSGGGAYVGRGNGAALLAVPLLARAATSWRQGGQQCLGIVGRPTLIGVMLSWWWGSLQCLAIVGSLSLTGVTTRRQRGRRRCLGIVGCSLARSCDSGGGRWTAVTCFCAGGGGGQTKVPQLCCAMVVGARPAIVPLDSRLSLACTGMARIETTRTDSGGSGGGASDGGGNGLALLAVPLLARATMSWRRGGQQCLKGHTRSVEGQGRNIGRRFKVGWAADVCTGRCLMGFLVEEAFPHC